jgi:hypothetical protein
MMVEKSGGLAMAAILRRPLAQPRKERRAPDAFSQIKNDSDYPVMSFQSTTIGGLNRAPRRPKIATKSLTITPMFFICSRMEIDTPSAQQAATAHQPSTGILGEDTNHCRQILGNLMDIGNEMAAILLGQIRAQQDEPEAAQKTVTAFATLAQTVRRTIMLHDKLGQPGKPRRNRVMARRKIIRDVEDAIERNAPPDEQETLHNEFVERLDRPDLAEELADRPIGDIVTDIIRDLGVADLDGGHPGKRRIPHDIAILNARAEMLPGTGPSEKLLALLAAAPPRPPRRATGKLYRDPALNVANMSDEEIKERLRRLHHLREP